MNDQTQKLVASLVERLEAVRRRMTILDSLSGLLLTVGSVSALWLIFVLVEAGLWLPSAARVSLLAASVFTVIVFLVYFVLYPIARFFGIVGRFTEQSLARMVGSAYPGISDRLINLLQLAQGAHDDAPNALLDRAVRELGEEIQPIPFEGIASTAKTKRIAKYILIPLVAIVMFAGASPNTFLNASVRILSPATSFSRPAPFSITVVPGNVEIIKGENVPIEAKIIGTDEYADVILDYVYEGEVRSRNQTLTADSTGSFRYVFEGLRQSLTYRILASPVETDWFTVSVVERPVVQRLDVRLDYPAYTRLPSRALETNVGDIAALAGTRASLHLALGGAPSASGYLIFSDGTHQALSVDNDRASTSIVIAHNTHYEIELLSPEGVSNQDPIAYEINVIEDAVPFVSFMAPEPVSELSEEALVSLVVRFTDDFGFSSVKLFFRLAESRFGSPSEEFTSIHLPLDQPYLLDQVLVHDWNITVDTPLDPIPGDVIEYYVSVWDNDTVRGFKPSSTRLQTLRFPSMAEQYEQLGDAEDDAENTLEDLLDEARRIREQFETLKEDLRQKPESNWQDERRLEQLKQQQKELESSVEDISQIIQEITEEMSENDLVSEDTIELFEELRKVVDEINSPDLMEALENLQESLERMDLSRMQQNLEDFEFNEQLYMERLDRALELFKNLRLQQDLEEAERRTENLAELEDRIQEETAKLENELDSEERERPRQAKDTSDNAERPAKDERHQVQDAEHLATEQEQAAHDMQSLEKKLEDIRERMEELRSAPTEKMQDLEEDTRDLQLPQQMMQNAEELRQQEFQQAQKSQQQMTEQLNQLQSQLHQMQQNMQGQQLQLNMAGIRASLEDILTLSLRQEALRLHVLTMRSESPRLRAAAREQVELSEGLTVVADSLQRLARKIPQMSRVVQQQSGEALREMGTAVGFLTERSARRAAGNQKAAMTHLNELALVLSELLNQMMSGQASSGSGMSMQQLMEQLQNMGEQQEMLNQQIQQLLNDLQGNRLTSDMVERMRQLGSQQDQIRRDLKKINRDRTARNKLLGDLTRLADQMQESVQDLLQGRANRQLMQRQRQILTRLLEASKSLQERGKERKRESRIGTDLERESPAELTPGENVEKLRRELFRALESGYAPDFEQLIRKYFELLQRQIGEKER